MNKVPYLPTLFKLTLILSLCCFIYFLIINGGFMSIIYSLQLGEESTLIVGNFFSHFLFVSFPILTGLAQCMYSTKKIKKMIFIFILIYVFIVVSLPGGRGGGILSVLSAIVIYNYINKKLHFKSFIKYLYLLVLIIPFITILPKLRSLRTANDVINNPIEYIFKSNIKTEEEKIEILADISRAYIPIFIIDHFNINNFWYGNSLKDLFLGLIPRQFYPDKPPVNEGAYIFALSKNLNVAPSMPMKKISVTSSWPPRTLGCWYANFGFLGVLFSSFFFGKLYMFFYNKMHTEKGVFFLLLYPSIIFSFQLSNLGIVNFCILAIVLYFLILLVRFFKPKYENKNCICSS
ncbi:MAG: oligosaccharide repeat unit polymerase [Mycoplasmataceae bacterium]|nr:oligosaccharide repeat unit polymerase [Mycoplasmataceae bacterium]